MSNCYVNRIVLAMTSVGNHLLFCWIIGLCWRFYAFLGAFGHFWTLWVVHGRTWTGFGVVKTLHHKGQEHKVCLDSTLLRNLNRIAHRALILIHHFFFYLCNHSLGNLVFSVSCNLIGTWLKDQALAVESFSHHRRMRQAYPSLDNST